jgi:hypothetical protein
VSASARAFESRSDLIGAFADVIVASIPTATLSTGSFHNRSAQRERRMENLVSSHRQPVRPGSVEHASHARPGWQRGRGRPAQADVDGHGPRSARRVVASEHFRVSGDGHRALEAWARQFGPIVRWGIEGASAFGRHTAIFLAGRGYDVRDVCPNRTGRQDRARQRGKSDVLDSERGARETLGHPLLPTAFKRAGQDAGPDQQAELLAIWWQARCSLRQRRQHLLSEADALLGGLPLELIERLPETQKVRPRLAALRHATGRRRFDPPTALLRTLGGYRAEIAKLDTEDKQVT